MRRFLLILPLVVSLLTVMPVEAHVGSSEIYLQGQAGPYHLYITVVPPLVIPGQAQLSVYADDHALNDILVQPNILSTDASTGMPAADKLEHVAGTQIYQGSVWIMSTGSWQARLQAEGTKGTGVLSVPIAATPMQLKTMNKPLGAILILCCLLLVAGFIGMAGAAVRESQLDPGLLPDASRKHRGAIAVSVALFIAIGILLVGNHWWREEIQRYSSNIYKPLHLETTLDGSLLHLKLVDPGWLDTRRLDDLIPDHNHLMHLYVVREPAMDAVLHLHPSQMAPGNFDLPLPEMRAGKYTLFADIVHADGFPETATATLDLPQTAASTVKRDADDASGILPPLGNLQLSAAKYLLPNGYSFLFSTAPPGVPLAVPPAHFSVNAPVVLHFTLLDPKGNVPKDMENYMGMLGHAAIIKMDGSVFAHIHPEGSISMAAYMMANGGVMSMPGMDMDMPMPEAASKPASSKRDPNIIDGMEASSMPEFTEPSTTSTTPMDQDPNGPDGASIRAIAAMQHGRLANVAAFPYGFPAAGRYRIVIQMKHGSTVETGAFDIDVQ